MVWSRESRHARGYGTPWDKLRKVVLRRDNGLCQCDECKGVKLLAKDVHHIKQRADGGTDDLDNLISLNQDCHNRIHGNVVKQTFGKDGWPK